MHGLHQSRHRPLGLGIRGLAVTALLALAACAGAPEPKEQMAVARTVVESVSEARAADHAPVEMRKAQEKLRAAEKAMAAGDNVEARRLAEQAEVDAKLAQRKAQAIQAQQGVAELRQGIRLLQQEIQQP